MHTLPKRLTLPAVAAFCGALVTFTVALPAQASTCYVVLDRADTVVYQGRMPPYDLSSAGNSAREAMRKRGEFMEMYEAPACPDRNALSAAGKGEASVDDIVATIRPYQRVGRPGALPAATPSEPFAVRDTDRVTVNVR